ncbi:MAG: site-2 protease family protein [Phycisphaerales bacterium]
MSEPDWSSSYRPDQPGDRFAKIKLILARVFGDGENPLAWGFTMFRSAGIRFRIHVLFLALILSELIFTLPGHHAGFDFVWPSLVAMLVLVLAHEIGHCVVCRRLGGEVDEVMLWPLGGLSRCRVPEHWRAELLVAIAGPMVNLLLVPVFALPLYVLTGGFEALGFNPLVLGASSSVVHFPDGTTVWWLVLLEAMYSINLVLLVFNLLVPMLPLDSARILMALLWKRSGESKAMWQTATIGLGVATALGLVGLVFQDGKMLFAIAIFGGIVCSMERRRLQFLQYGQMIPGLGDAGEAWKQGGLVDEDDEEIIPQEEVDRILGKITASGMDSLSRKERRLLKRATESSRKSQ